MSQAVSPAADPIASPTRLPGPERRAAVRYVTTMEASYHPVAMHTVGPSSPARIWDLSLGGVALIVNRPLEVGATVAVVPESLPASLYPGLDARVVHARPHDAAGLWLVGCAFLTPLTEEQLAALLG
jgi:hypothetical protein